jgi:hypothetical protein
MARFMIAHLQDGRYSDANIAEARILNKSTMQQMHSTLYTPDPRLLGTAHGFFDFSDNGQRTIGHLGESDPINTLLLLLPDQNLGVFVFYSSEGGRDLTLQHFGFQRAFFDHYYPTPAVKPIQPPALFAQRSGRFEGSYRLTGVHPGLHIPPSKRSQDSSAQLKSPIPATARCSLQTRGASGDLSKWSRFTSAR